ncbi:hypothetical protein IWQ60_007443 [Tieghemiomyces parasiticus]|uniref:Uncharacterized protein n=1 Tax=Tieghemiomyces parasiticus TaxID=78921 RepID=A0A9W8A5F2_9FUNG|nr:hypothetical protein IWQ60_007443 [Tieghemiomyces parasiticus]
MGPVKPLAAMSPAELHDTLAQNDKLLADSALLKCLPDQGQTIRQTNVQIRARLQRLQATDLDTTQANWSHASHPMAVDQTTSPGPYPNPKCTVAAGASKTGRPTTAPSGKVQEISIAESIQLQATHQRQVEEANLEAVLRKMAEASLENGPVPYSDEDDEDDYTEADSSGEHGGAYDDAHAFIQDEARALRRQFEP